MAGPANVFVITRLAIWDVIRHAFRGAFLAYLLVRIPEFAQPALAVNLMHRNFLPDQLTWAFLRITINPDF